MMMFWNCLYVYYHTLILIRWNHII